MMLKSTRAISLIEVVVAAVIGSLLAGGTLMAFVLASKVSNEALQQAEALSYAVETIERFRNRVACDDAWFDDAGVDCNFSGVDLNLPQGMTADDLPDPTDPPTSVLIGRGMSETRRYQVLPSNCDGVAGADCYTVNVVVNWTPNI